MRRFVVAFVPLLLLGLAAWYVRYVPLRGGYLIVSFAKRADQTNEMGQVIPLFCISNGGPRQIQVSAGTESKSGTAVSLNLSSPVNLKPGEEVLIPVMLPVSSPQSRVLAYCQKIYPQGWLGRIQWCIDVYVLKRGAVERVYIAEK